MLERDPLATSAHAPATTQAPSASGHIELPTPHRSELEALFTIAGDVLDNERPAPRRHRGQRNDGGRLRRSGTSARLPIAVASLPPWGRAPSVS
jgi:hypothetical protein